MLSLIKIINNTQHLLRSQLHAITTVRGRRANVPKKRYPFWFTRQHRVMYKDNISEENKKFIKEVVENKYGAPSTILGVANYISPLKETTIEPTNENEWKEDSRRTGVIAKKIGCYPMWLKNGQKVTTTLLHVIDNHVIKYIPPEKHEPRITVRPIIKRKLGCLIVGAESVDPQFFTKEYCGLFNDSGVMPKRRIMRFLVSPDAAIQPGTSLHAAHFKVGDFVDIRGKTIDRGFQGVMKRWGFHGMPATHGQTKTHRRPGNIGSGGERGVIKGTKMPGHMGNRYRVFRGYQILKINTKYNVIWVKGHNIPGELNEFVQIYDTVLPLRKPTTPPNFPTYFPNRDGKLPEELYYEDLHDFSNPTIMYPEKQK